MNYEGYYFNPLLLIVMAGAKAACLDQYQVELSAPLWSRAVISI